MVRRTVAIRTEASARAIPSIPLNGTAVGILSDSIRKPSRAACRLPATGTSAAHHLQQFAATRRHFVLQPDVAIHQPKLKQPQRDQLAVNP